MWPHYCVLDTFGVALSTTTGKQQAKKKLCCEMVFAIKGITQTRIQSSVEKLGDVEH